MLRNVDTGELRYYHPSQNNAGFFDVPHWIRNEEDLQTFLDDMSHHDILGYIRQKRPDTKWVMYLLTNVTFYVNKVNNYPIGASVLLPAYVSNNTGLNNLTGGSHGTYIDNICFFRCLTIHRRATFVNGETSTKTYYHRYVNHTELPLRDVKGLYLDESIIVSCLFVKLFTIDYNFIYIYSKLRWLHLFLSCPKPKPLTMSGDQFIFSYLSLLTMFEFYQPYTFGFI